MPDALNAKETPRRLLFSRHAWALMTAAFQPRTNGPAHWGQSRFFASPSRTQRHGPRHRHSRPANRRADRKTAPGIFLAPAPKTHRETPSQSVGTYQESTTYVFVFASGCAVAPNSGGMNLQQAQALAAQLGWNGFTTNLSESQQLYYGQTAANILALQAQGRDMSQQWAAVLSEVPGVITDSNGNMASDSADAARGSFLSLVNGPAAGMALGAVITGYTWHGLNQAISRDDVGVSPAAILDAVTNPISTIPQSGGAVQYIGTNATVVLNANGKVITTWANNSSGIRIVPGNANNQPGP